jgi:hypothetical protein
VAEFERDHTAADRYDAGRQGALSTSSEVIISSAPRNGSRCGFEPVAFLQRGLYQNIESCISAAVVR